MEKFQSIRTIRVSKNRHCISLMWDSKRYRYYNGSIIGSSLCPNKLIKSKIKDGFEQLNAQFKEAIEAGWKPGEDWSYKLKKDLKKSSILDIALMNKLSREYSVHYKKRIAWVAKELKLFLKGRKLNKESASQFLNQPKWSNAMRNNVRSHYVGLESELQKLGYEGSVVKLVRKERVYQTLHRPFRDVQAVLASVQEYNRALHLCCLLSYGCLLRPHREIRLLTWRDISEDFSQISLAGSQNKGKRNRIVPVGEYIKPYLKAFKSPLSTNEDNVFTGNKEPYNPDYFKTLWTRYKKKSKLIEKDQTLYSFRHTGAIQVYEKTGSLTKLQQVMGHSSLQVSLTYLRGLEVKQLDAEDMPTLE